MVYCQMHIERFGLWETDRPFVEPGTEVWETFEAALAQCVSGYAVYRVAAGWEETEPSALNQATWRHLTRRAAILPNS